MKAKIGVFFGGQSTEHEVSVISAIQAIHSMDKDKYDIIPIYISKKGGFYSGPELMDIDAYKNLDGLLVKATPVVIFRDHQVSKVFLYKYPFGLLKKPLAAIDLAFPIMHGGKGEKGSLQGFFEMLDLPYVGSDVISSEIGMDKIMTKHVLKSIGIPVVEFYGFYKNRWLEDEAALIADIEEKLTYPMIVKPACGGSSIGVTKAENQSQLIQGIELAITMDIKIIVEKMVQNLREINCSVLGDYEHAIASPCEEPSASKDILTFEDKYMSESRKGMSSAKREIPANISEELTKRIQEMSVHAFKEIGWSGVIRIDYMLDDATGEVYFNEANTIPGSLAFYLWQHDGKKYTELLDDMIKIALNRYKREKQINYSFDNNLFQQSKIKGFKK